MMRRILIGVDTGKRQHQVAAYALLEEQWLGQFSIAVSLAGFEHLRTFLGSLGVASEGVLIGVEATGHDHLTWWRIWYEQATR